MQCSRTKAWSWKAILNFSGGIDGWDVAVFAGACCARMNGRVRRLCMVMCAPVTPGLCRGDKWIPDEL